MHRTNSRLVRAKSWKEQVVLGCVAVIEFVMSPTLPSSRVRGRKDNGASRGEPVDIDGG